MIVPPNLSQFATFLNFISDIVKTIYIIWLYRPSCFLLIGALALLVTKSNIVPPYHLIILFHPTLTHIGQHHPFYSATFIRNKMQHCLPLKTLFFVFFIKGFGQVYVFRVFELLQKRRRRKKYISLRTISHFFTFLGIYKIF